MSKIKIMDEILANKIAAGEVVEKCVSVVKELVENSCDANADEIIIELKEAGLREIKVIDNGIGMDREDAICAFQRHATSKIYNDSDLFSITTLGFRGEALPSIASVSEVILKTCQDDVGTTVHIKGGKIIDVSSSESRIGTSIVVKNLFYNTPARLKHLSSVNTELANIVEYINKMALSHTDIRFVLINDNKELLNTKGDGNLLKVIKSIYGVDVAKKMLEIKINNQDYNVYGYISLPEVNRASRSHITLIVNGRVVRNTYLNKTINDAYSSYKENTRYPIVVIIIETDPSLIDVNVHPAKLEVKFSNFDDLKNLIYNNIEKTISKKLLIPKIEVKESVSTKVENLSLNFIKEEEVEYNNKLSDIINMNNNVDNLLEEEIDNSYVEEVVENDKLPELYPVGLALGTYIICQNQNGIYLIDQHAAQERINYEKFLYELTHPNNNVINPLFPIIIELPLNEFLIIQENIEILNDLNIQIEQFGTSSYRVKGHPTWFVEGFENEIIKSIFEIICSKVSFSLEKFRDNLAASLACKASIKANTNITMDAMEVLISNLRKCNNPFNCPHGRPTIIHFTIYELEKMFKRSM